MLVTPYLFRSDWCVRYNMQLRNLISEERAVSPVIGVILMVAITVILAAVIGTFVLGLGDSLQDTSPQASFGFDYGDAPDTGGVTISHEGGDSVDAALLSLNVDGTQVVDGWPGATSVGAGTSATILDDGQDTTAADTEGYAFDSPTAWDSEEIRVVWTSNDGSSSQTIARSTAPSS